jgi:hypothetical protein
MLERASRSVDRAPVLPFRRMRSYTRVLLPIVLVLFVPAARCMAGGPFGICVRPHVHPIAHSVADSADAPSKENTRLVSSTLALLLGPFAAHRIYLGTTPKVAIIYGVTFGGFGLLAITDLGHLLFTKDLEPYRNNDRVFMWAEKHHTPTPP